VSPAVTATDGPEKASSVSTAAVAVDCHRHAGVRDADPHRRKSDGGEMSGANDVSADSRFSDKSTQTLAGDNRKKKKTKKSDGCHFL
jgi:hypothetical protein